MSAVAAVVHFDGRPVGAESLSRLVAAVAHRGPDRTRVWRQGHVGLGHALLATTPEARTEAVPAVSPDGRLALVFDGRLDDRAELARALGIDTRVAPGDGALALAAYDRWGEAAFGRLLGDFAAALWDGRRGCLVLARDLFGQRPLCYRLAGASIWCASTARAAAGDGRDPDEDTVAEWLLAQPLSPAGTLYRHVRRVPPAHVVVASASGLRVEPYWAPDTVAPARIADAREAAAQFTEVLLRATRDRLRAPAGARVSVALSGGLDSSLVYALAHEASAGSVDARTLCHDDPAIDESPYARAVADHLGGTWSGAPPAAADFDYAAAPARDGELPPHPSGAASSAVRRRAARDNVRVLLTGVGGDEWFAGSRWHLADLLAGGRWLELARWCRADARAPLGLPGLLRHALWPLVPAPWRESVRRVVKRRAVPPWIDPAFARRTGLVERRALARPIPARSLALRDRVQEAWSPLALAAHEEQERLAVSHGMEDRQPFLDRRVVEFAVALAESLRAQPGRPKAVLRDAARTRLPAAVIERPPPPGYSHLLADALRRVGGARLFERLTIAERGWVVPGAARELLAAFEAAHARRDPGAWRLAGDLWALAAVEIWHRTPAGEGAGVLADRLAVAAVEAARPAAHG